MSVRIPDLAHPPKVENPYPFPLDPFQMCAIKAIDDHEHVLVTAKTGSGKTLVGEYQIRVSLFRGNRVFYTTPIKSLSNQKFHDLKEAGISVGIMTGDIKFAPDSDVVVMTTEMLCNMLFKKDESLSLDRVDAIIFDEVHYINDPERGKVWEQCIFMLPPAINLVMLSATISDAHKFAGWIANVKQAPVHLISTQYRVVPLVHMIGFDRVVMDARDTFHPQVYLDWIRELYLGKKKEREHAQKVADRRRDGYEDGPISGDKSKSYLHRMNELVGELETRQMLPALFFVFSRAKCQEYASKVTHDLLDSSDTASVKHIISFHLHKYPDVQISPQYHQLKSLLEKGIAFHHSGLLPILKEIVEILFAKGFVKLLFATETFAVGINMPTKTVVFTSYEKNDGNGIRMLRTSEYIQMAGRAGRRGKDTQGYVMYLPDRDPSSPEEVRRMMTGSAAAVSSQMDFGYDFIIKNLYGSLCWKEAIKKTYWFQQLSEQIRSLQDDRRKLVSKVEALPLTPDIVEELGIRTSIEAKIATLTNAKRKEAQRQLAMWKDSHREHKWELASAAFSEWTELNRQKDEIDRTIREAEQYEETVETRIAFLDKHHFLTDPLGLYASHIHEGHSLLMSYAFHHKMFHGMDLPQFIGCLALFGGDEKDEVRLSDCKLYTLNTKHRVEWLASVASRMAHEGTAPESYWKLNFYWADVAIQWISAQHVEVEYEGNFVRAMLKLANLADEWVALATLSSDIEQLELMRDIRQKIVRGVVVPDSLYLRI